MSALDTTGREQLARDSFGSVGKNPAPGNRILILNVLLRASPTGLDQDQLEQALQAELARLDLDAVPTWLLVALAQTAPARHVKGVPLRDAVLARHKNVVGDDRASFVRGMAAIAPTEMLLDLLHSLEQVRSFRRIVPLESLAVELVARADQETVWKAWKAVLQMTSTDSRRDFFNQIRSCVPLATRLGGAGCEVELAQSILHITTCFP